MAGQSNASTPGSDARGSLSLETTVALLRRFRTGQSEALDRLIERYLPPFRHWATHRLPRWARDGLDTEDLVQDTLLHAVQRLDDFEPRHEGALLDYLRQALRNRIRDEIRRRHRRGPALTLDSRQPDCDPSPLQEAIGREALERYEAAIQRLSDADREAIVARVEMKHSWDEVAMLLGKPSADAARKATCRALQRLAKEMSLGS